MSRPNSRKPDLLSVFAWLNVVTHLVALGFSAAAIKPGNAVISLTERLNYLAASPMGWRLGWGFWMLSALSLVAFFAASAGGVAIRIPRYLHLARLALMLACAGAAIDLFCDMIQLSVLPMVAAQGSSARVSFLVVERIAVIGGQVVANGLYSVASLLLSIGLSGYGRPARWAVGLGYGVFGMGMLLVLAGIMDDPGLAATSGVLTIILFCLWVVLAASFLARFGAEP